MDPDAPSSPDQDKAPESQSAATEDKSSRGGDTVESTSGLGQFWSELKRRKVVRVAIAYAVVAWLLIQISDTVFPRIGLPEWAPTLVIAILSIGFPIALIFAWAFQLTAEGIKVDSEARVGGSVTDTKGHKLNYITLGLVVLVLTFLVVDRYLIKSEPLVTQLDGNSAPASGETMRFTIDLPATLEFPGGRGLALSPDGQNIVFAARREASEIGLLFRRSIDQLDIVNLAEGAYPFFSPDGRSLGFQNWPGRVLRQIPLAGGPIQRLEEVQDGIRGAHWGYDGMIVVGRAPGLARFSASGGTVTYLIPGEEEYQYWYPQALPKSGAILFTYSLSQPDAGELQLLFPETGERRTLLPDAVAGRVLDSGHLVFVRDGALWAAPFDPDRLELIGNAEYVQDGVHVEIGGATQYAVSDNGTLVYVSRPPNTIGEGALVLMDKQGGAQKIPLPPNRYVHPRFSPDGNRIAVEIHSNSRSDIFIYELASRQLRQLTSEGGAVPLWTPDGSHITYVAEGALWNIAVDLIEEPQRLNTSRDGVGVIGPNSWSPDGSILLFQAGAVINQLTLLEDGEAEYSPLLASRGMLGKGNPHFSSDGDWLSFQRITVGGSNVYVQPYPLGGGRRQMITQGVAGSAVWSKGSNELFFSNEGQLWTIEIETEPTLSWQDPVALFDLPWPVQKDDPFVNYDVTPDGQQFVFIEPLEEQVDERPRQIQVVLNWVEELNRLVPIPE